MATRFKHMLCGTSTFLGLFSIVQAQLSSPIPSSSPIPMTTLQPAAAPIAPAKVVPPPIGASGPGNNKMMVVQAGNVSPAPAISPVIPANPVNPAGAPATTEPESSLDSGGVGVREFQGDDVGQVLRLLARQSKINMVVSEAVTGTVTMRLEDVTALQAIAIIVKAKGLFMDKIDNVYYIKTAAERGAEPTESDSYQFSYSRAKEMAPLVAAQLASKDVPQIDERTNTIFYRETRSNIDNVRKLLVQIDKPTKQVMIEARLVEVTANPRQSYGINWAGVVGSSTQPQTFRYAGSSLGGQPTTTVNADGTTTTVPGTPAQGMFTPLTGALNGNDFLFGPNSFSALAGQFAILSAPQLSVTLRALNEDNDAEFLANPRVVTADNMKATIEITRNQPVPQLNFNEQTATAVFGGFQDKTFGTTLAVTPLINKDNYITLKVQPVISNKVGDSTFIFAGATVNSPIIDTRKLDSNVLIKTGDTLAIGGLLQDEQTKARNKVPVLGDLPILGYFFSERLNARVKRNLLVFVTPTIVDQHYGTGLEDQVGGLHHTGEEYADPNGWRNNAKGAVRLVPTSQRELVADYPKPGVPPAPAENGQRVRFMSTAKDRDF